MSARNAPAPRLAATPADVLTRMRRALDASARKLWLGGALTLDLSVSARTMILSGNDIVAKLQSNSDGVKVVVNVPVAALAPVLPLTGAGAALGAAAALIGAILYLRDVRLWMIYVAGQFGLLVALFIGTCILTEIIIGLNEGESELGREFGLLIGVGIVCGLVAIIVSATRGWIEWAEEHMPAEVSHVPALRAPPPPPPPRDNVMY